MNFKLLFARILIFSLAISSLMITNSNASNFTLSANPDCGYILLTWSRVQDATRYDVYRGIGSGMESSVPISDYAITENTYQDKANLSVNQKYCYLVKAINKQGQEISTSTEACATYVCDESIPKPPDISIDDCKMVIKYQIDNRFYWKNEIRKGPMDASPENRFSRVNLMARYLSEEIGASVGWVNSTQTVTIRTLEGTTIEMQIGKSIARINGVPTPLDPNNPKVVPYISYGRTYTPLRFIAYNLGATGISDIIWRGDVNTAELTFKDPYCKWICGCIRTLPSFSAQYGFFENCSEDKPLYSTIPIDMEDKIYKLTFLEYFRKYPNQDYWCVQIRVDESGNIISWRARPDQYPNCCETSVGKARIIGYVSGAGLSDTFVTIYDSNKNKVWSGFTNSDGYYETSATGVGCKLKCPGTYSIVPTKEGCTFTKPSETVTFTELQCCDNKQYKRVDFVSNCPSTKKGRISGYIIGSGGNIATTVSIYDSKNDKVWSGVVNNSGYYESSANGSPCILKCPGTYKVVPTKEGCTFVKPSETVIFEEGDCCEDSKTKRVDFTCNCPPPKTAKIIGYVYGTGGNPGTTISIYNSNNDKVWSGQTNVNGYYETSSTGASCILSCPGTYKVVPTKAGCTFTKSTETVTLEEGDCCEEGKNKRVDFNAVCSPPKTARIAGYIYGAYGNPGTTVTIYDSTDTKVWTGITSANGYYESSAIGSVCVLKCPGTYKVVPTKTGCTFTNPSEVVIFSEGSCCEDGKYKRVDFNSSCNPPKTARITGFVYGTGVNPGTTISVQDSTGKVVWSGETSDTGYYETSATGSPCVLKCPGTYKIVPTKTGCTFTNTNETVTFTEDQCCDKNQSKRVDFNSNCPPPKTGRIVGYVYGQGVNPGTTITILDSTGKQVWTGATNANGYFETSAPGADCILKCPGTYKVTPTKTGCNFTNAFETVTFTEGQCCEEDESKRVDFNSNCPPPTNARIIGYVTGTGIITGITITIANSSGTQVWSGTTNENGYYETSSTGANCILPSPGTYKITPSKAGCTFTNNWEVVSFLAGESCEDGYYMRVDFRAVCSPTLHTEKFAPLTYRAKHLTIQYC